MLIGRKFRKIKRYKKKGIASLTELSKMVQDECMLIVKGQEYIEKNIPQKKKLINLIINSASSPFTINNKSQILNNGADTFQSFFQAIELAEHHIHLEFYIVKDDQIGTQMQELLIKKAKEGVKVRLIYDGYGSLKLDQKFLDRFEKNGIQTVCFSPVILPIINKIGRAHV